MIENKTVFVIGAGASQEVGMPLGEELKGVIASDLRFMRTDHALQFKGDVRVGDALNKHFRKDLLEKQKACMLIERSMPLAISIDSYLSSHSQDPSVTAAGKVAIVNAILNAERGSNLYQANPEDFDPSRSVDSWLNRLFKLITQEASLEDLPQRLRQLYLIVFNYDRCVEHFLYLSFITFYGVDGFKAAELVSYIGILHPYGVVGTLTWQDDYRKRIGREHINDGPPMSFGQQPTADQLIKLSNAIKVFTETNTGNEEIVSLVRRWVSDADYLIFLGFAYHRQNMEILFNQRAQPSIKSKQIFGSAYQFSENNTEQVANELRHICKVHPVPIRNNLTCTGLLDEYWGSLSL